MVWTPKDWGPDGVIETESDDASGGRPRFDLRRASLGDTGPPVECTRAAGAATVIDAKPCARIRDRELLHALVAGRQENVRRARREDTPVPASHPPAPTRRRRGEPGGVLRRNSTSGCHGRVEARDAVALALLRNEIEDRHDVIEYLDAKLGGLTQALAWLDRYVA